MLENILLVGISLLLGWVALWPSRRALGSIAYHLSAYPVGLIGWSLVTTVAAITGRGYGWLPVALGFVALAAVSWVVPALASPSTGAPPSAWSYAATGLVVMGTATAFAAAGVSAGAYDSVFHYTLPGVWLSDTGRLTGNIIGAYGPLLPSLHAAGAMLGTEWLYVVYPVFAGHVLALLGYASYRWAFAALRPAARAAAALGVTGLLAATPVFVFNSVYVHSQMATAGYLLGALAALRGAHDADPSNRTAWLALAGLMTAGLALTRPDGLAYVFVILAVATPPMLARWRPADAFAMTLPPALILAAFYATAFLTQGLWETHALSGMEGAVMLAALASAVVVLLAIRGVEPLAARLRDETLLREIVYSALILGVLAVSLARPEDFASSTSNIVTNLLFTGGYGRLWHSLAGLVALTLAFGWIRRKGDWDGALLLAVVSFFSIGLAVHGAAHTGRLSPADSFNRVTFHILPVLYWYLGAFAGAALEGLLSEGIDS